MFVKVFGKESMPAEGLGYHEVGFEHSPAVDPVCHLREPAKCVPASDSGLPLVLPFPYKYGVEFCI